MPAYDAAHFDPPAPVASVTLRNPASGAAVSEVILLVDTGADLTLLPRGAVERIGIAPLGEQYEVVGFDGHTSVAPVVVLDMVLLGRTFRGRYLLTEGEQGIVGRDILNHVAVVFDGPRRQWWEWSG